MPKDTEHSCSERNRVHPYRPNPNHGKSRDEGRKMEWEDATCPICMDFPHNAVLLLCSSHDRGCRPYICNTGRRHSNCLRQYRKAHLEVKKVSPQNESPNPNVIGSPPGEVNLTVEALSVTFVTVSAETGLAVSSRRFTSFDETGITITSRSVNSSDVPDIPTGILRTVDDVMSNRNPDYDAMPTRSTDNAMMNRDNDETMSVRDRQDSTMNRNTDEMRQNRITDETMESENNDYLMFNGQLVEAMTNRNTDAVILSRQSDEEFTNRNTEDVMLTRNTGDDEAMAGINNDDLALTANTEEVLQSESSEGASARNNDQTITLRVEEAILNRNNGEATPIRNNDEAIPNSDNSEATSVRNNDAVVPNRSNDEAIHVRLNEIPEIPVERTIEAEVVSGNGTVTTGISQQNLVDIPDQFNAENSSDPERFPVDEDEEMEEPGAVDQNSENVMPDLKCPLCRGAVCEWKVIDGAREHLNQKRRSCSEESCPFIGTYPELKAHAKSEHPLARPSEVDPTRMRDWRRMEHQRNVGDVLSSIRATMPGATVIGDHVLETGSENEAEESNLLSVPALLFLHWFGSPTSGGGRILLPTAWSLRGHRRGRMVVRGAAASNENNDSSRSSVNGDSEQENPGSTEHQERSEV